MADAVLDVLRTNGFADEDATALFGMLSSYTVGFSLMQRSRPVTRADEIQERIDHLKQASQYPVLSAVAESFVKWPRDDVFDVGLARLLDAH
jgi:hypothetical protein